MQTEMPTSKKHFEDWKTFQIDGRYKALVMSDIHVPYHNGRIIKAAVKYAKDRKCNLVLLNGDLMDFYAVSRWEVDPRQRDFGNEIRAGRQFLKWLRGQFPNARIIFKEGNHDERWEKYILSKTPDLLRLKEFSLSALLKLEELNIELVGDCQPIGLGKLMVIHGHEYKFSISNPVSPARGMLLKALQSTLCGHFHQTSQHTQQRLDGHIICTMSTGCMCDMRYGYAPINNHNHGFAIVEVLKDGTYNPENHRIIHGKVY